MMTHAEEARAIRAGEPLPAETIIARRSSGVHAIRREFIIRLLQSGVRVNTLDVYWDDTDETLLSEEVTLVEYGHPEFTTDSANYRH